MKVRNSASPNHPSAFSWIGERIEKDDLDVEEDEEHRRQVEADGEAPVLRRRPAETPDSNGSMPLLDARRRPRREEECEGDHRCGDRGREEAVDEKRQPVGEHELPFPSGGVPRET